MKRAKRNQQVVEAWKSGATARNGRHTLWTNGESLWSYQVRIGTRLPSGATILADFTASSDSFVSQTTSCHVGIAYRNGVDLLMHPKVWKVSPVSHDEVPF